jgi:hypothetical protein
MALSVVNRTDPTVDVNDAPDTGDANAVSSDPPALVSESPLRGVARTSPSVPFALV